MHTSHFSRKLAILSAQEIVDENNRLFEEQGIEPYSAEQEQEHVECLSFALLDPAWMDRVLKHRLTKITLAEQRN